MALGEVEAGPAGSMAQGEVLQVALAALVTDGAVERVVDEQELQGALRLLRTLGDRWKTMSGC